MILSYHLVSQYLQSDLNGWNIFGTMVIRSRDGKKIYQMHSSL